jgi:hypothetical protein
VIHGSVTSIGTLSWQMSVALPMVSKPISMARQSLTAGAPGFCY